jgi:hypothetical protein
MNQYKGKMYFQDFSETGYSGEFIGIDQERKNQPLQIVNDCKENQFFRKKFVGNREKYRGYNYSKIQNYKVTQEEDEAKIDGEGFSHIEL